MLDFELLSHLSFFVCTIGEGLSKSISSPICHLALCIMILYLIHLDWILVLELFKYWKLKLLSLEHCLSCWGLQGQARKQWLPSGGKGLLVSRKDVHQGWFLENGVSI